jgi:hypothetical protein
MFTVYVDDNFHYMDENERYKLGEYPTFEEALAACKKIVDDFLKENFKPGMTADELTTQYVLYGEDPWIMGDGQPYHFSARDYAREQVDEICGNNKS